MKKTYIAIDLKSFYASQECIERGLDPLTANLVVADLSRTEKTICLAVSPALKSFGVPGRPRLFEVVQKVAQANALRRPKGGFTGKSYLLEELQKDRSLEIDYVVAKPRMGHYMECSNRIVGIYLKYVAPEDLHVYSIDEVFIDATHYLKNSGLDAHGFARKMIADVLEQTGITATAGIGTNLYLCKVAMDIVAKKMPPDKDGVRIAFLDEMAYKKQLWEHQPLTDFWRVGPGTARKLQKHGMRTMGDVARCSLGKPGEFYSEDLLYKLFGVNAELLIDHAWGYEPCTMADIKAYKPTTNSMSSGQVLTEPYPWDKARIVIREMADQMALELVEKGLVTDQITVTVGYDIENLQDSDRRRQYKGDVTTDHYGRQVPKHGHGTTNLPRLTASARLIAEAVVALFDRITDPALLVRRLNVTVNRLVAETACMGYNGSEQLNLFEEPGAQQQTDEELQREKRRQQAVLDIRKKFGKNAILRGMSLQDGATARQRNGQIGGHKE